jgi:hypothetical protein
MINDMASQLPIAVVLVVVDHTTTARTPMRPERVRPHERHSTFFPPVDSKRQPTHAPPPPQTLLASFLLNNVGGPLREKLTGFPHDM